MPELTHFQSHVARWKDCTACPLAACRQRVVLYRGRVPCDVLFVGEAPGRSENVLGQPFVGPAGILLDGMVKGAFGPVNDLRAGEGRDPLTWGFTNLVACIPLEEGTGAKTEQPPLEAIDACSERLREVVRIADPRLIIAVGKLAEQFLTPGYVIAITFHKPIPVKAIVHPAAILRDNLVHQGLRKQRNVVMIKDAIEELE